MDLITKFALNRSRVTIVFLIVTLLVGFQFFFTFPRQEDPPIVIREAVVTAFFPGMSPIDMEQLITRRIEAEIRTMPEIDDIWSDSKTGVCIIHADTRDEFDDLNLIWQRLRNKMRDLRPRLPEGTIGPFVNDEFGLTAVATVALWSEGFSMAEMRLVARDIRDRLYELEGVRKVELYGVQTEQVYLKFSTTKLSQFGISSREIIDTLLRQNVILPGGQVDAAGQGVIIEPSGNFEKIQDIADVLIRVPGTQQTTTLRDLMHVERGYIDPPRDMAYFNGKPAIVISLSVMPGTNTVDFGKQLTAKLTQLEGQLPIGYVLEYATYQPDLVKAAVDGALSNVYQTLVIVLVVVIIFLGRRTGMIVGSFVPFTMLLGLIIMRSFGVELERVSIASAIIALGMLVDNGIVVAEDIRTRLQRGEERREACITAGRTLAIPLLTSSLTTILAFVPMLLMEGQTGEYAYSLPMVVIILLLSSWFLSMYMTPAMCFWFMKTKKTEDAKASPTKETGEGTPDPYAGKLYQIYRKLLNQMLRFRILVLCLSSVVLAGGLFSSTLLVREMFGPSDRNQFLLYVDLPAGTRIEATDASVLRLTRWLADKEVNPEVTSSIAYVGTGGPRFFLSLSPVDPDPQRAFVVVNTQSGEQVTGVIQRIREKALNAFPELAVRVKAMWLGASEPGFVEIRLIGPDAEYLYSKGTQLVDKLQSIAGIIDVRSNWENKVPKVTVRVDQARARRAEITSREVAMSLMAHFDGVQVTDYREGDTAIPVVIQSIEEERQVLGDLWNINVYSGARGVTVPLSQIADIGGQWEFSRISRRNQERTLTVEARHLTLKAPELFQAMQPFIKDLQLSAEYRTETGGEIEKSAESMEKLFRWMPACLFGIVFLLIWQFNSIRRPLIILITLPLAFCGAFLGILFLGAPFDFFAILGLFSLAGVIINNGIVLIDRIDSERSQGKSPYDAIIASAVSRFRPICMTTITTVLGVLPLIISVDPLFYSLASILAFGLTFGTVLTLGVVPVLYAFLFRVPNLSPATQPAGVDTDAPL